MFYGCSSLTYLDDLSKWNINKVNDITMIFSNCFLLIDAEKRIDEFEEKNYTLKIKGEKDRMKKEIEERKRKKEEEEERRQNIKKEIFEKQKKFKAKKNNDEKVKIILEHMCILGNTMKKEIIEETKNEPQKFIPIEEALKEENKNSDIFCLGVLAQNLESIGITTAIERNKEKNDDKESQEASNTVLQFIMNGMIEKKKYEFHFDLGEERNNELLNNLDEQEKFNNK